MSRRREKPKLREGEAAGTWGQVLERRKLQRVHSGNLQTDPFEFLAKN